MTHYWSQEEYIKTYRYVAEAHRKQNVPGTCLPYIVHLSLVSMEVIAALNVEDVDNPDFAIQCALLHDIIEDQDYEYEEVNKNFGKKVADGVLALTKNNKLEESKQMKDSLERIKQQPREIWMVKLADRITNLQKPPKHWNQEKILRYREEACDIWKNLKEASPFLALRLREKIDVYDQYLKNPGG